MPVSPDLSGSFAAIPDQVPPAGLCWGAGNPQGAGRLTQEMDGACEERPPEAMSWPVWPPTSRAASLVQQVYRLQRDGGIMLGYNAMPETRHAGHLRVPVVLTFYTVSFYTIRFNIVERYGMRSHGVASVLGFTQ